MRVAIEYAGRWYGIATVPWLENHHTNIIKSSRNCTFDIFFALAKDQICVRTFIEIRKVKRVLSSVFTSKNVGNIHAEYIEQPQNISLLSKSMKLMVKNPSHASWKTTNMIAWYKQYWNIAMCEYMRRKTSSYSHDLILRTRVDTMMKHPENVGIFNIGERDMYFVRKQEGYSKMGKFLNYANNTYWCERMWITSPLGMNYILNIVRKPNLIYDSTCSIRCCGFCSEEQTENQLIRSNASLKLLKWDTYLVRIKHKLFQNVSFVSSDSCHTK